MQRETSSEPVPVVRYLFLVSRSTNFENFLVSKVQKFWGVPPNLLLVITLLRNYKPPRTKCNAKLAPKPCLGLSARDGEPCHFPLGSALGSRAEKEPTNSGSLGSAPLEILKTPKCILLNGVKSISMLKKLFSIEKTWFLRTILVKFVNIILF